jgi:hypothetical protein
MYATILLGIRRENVLSETQNTVLKNFIITQLGKHTLEEIRHALDLCVAMKLEMDSNVYQVLDSKFFAKLMKEYTEHARRQGFKKENEIINEPKKDMTEEIIKDLNETFEKCLISKSNVFKNELENNGVPYENYISTIYTHYKERNKLEDETRKQIKRKSFNEVCKRFIEDRDTQSYINFVTSLEKNTKYFAEYEKLTRVYAFEEMLIRCFENGELIVL